MAPGDMVNYFNMASSKPGPYRARVLAADGKRLDLEVIDLKHLEKNVSHRGIAEGGRFWDIRNAS